MLPFRHPACDYQHLAELLAGLHFIVTAMLTAHRFVTLTIQSA
jgi:hypothetical protein